MLQILGSSLLDTHVPASRIFTFFSHPVISTPQLFLHKASSPTPKDLQTVSFKAMIWTFKAIDWTISKNRDSGKPYEFKITWCRNSGVGIWVHTNLLILSLSFCLHDPPILSWCVGSSFFYLNSSCPVSGLLPSFYIPDATQCTFKQWCVRNRDDGKGSIKTKEKFPGP